jgi:glycogen operon protein
MVSAYWEPLTFALPEPPMGPQFGWRRLIDTAQPSPADIAQPESADLTITDSYSLLPRSIVLLFAPQ